MFPQVTISVFPQSFCSVFQDLINQFSLYFSLSQTSMVSVFMAGSQLIQP